MLGSAGHERCNSNSTITRSSPACVHAHMRVLQAWRSKSLVKMSPANHTLSARPLCIANCPVDPKR
jgi:hypothetical protein